MANNIFLGLGSNQGERIDFLRKAIHQIDNDEYCSVEKISSIYETKPYGVKEQDNFFNVVIKINSSYSLSELFQRLKLMEKEIGKMKLFRWGPREIDIDILFFDDLVYSDDKIIIPHKDFLNREFVLKPMQEISPEFIHPVVKKKIGELDDAKEKLIINKYNPDLLKTDEDKY